MELTPPTERSRRSVSRDGGSVARAAAGAGDIWRRPPPAIRAARAVNASAAGRPMHGRGLPARCAPIARRCVRV